MPLYAVTIVDTAEIKIRTRIVAPDEHAAEERAEEDFNRGGRQLKWYLVAEDGDQDLIVEPIADDAPADPPYVSWNERFGAAESAKLSSIDVDQELSYWIDKVLPALLHLHDLILKEVRRSIRKDIPPREALYYKVTEILGQFSLQIRHHREGLAKMPPHQLEDSNG